MKTRMKEWQALFLLLAGVSLLAVSCGGGGGSTTTPAAATPAVPTDAATITTTGTRQLVQSFSTIMQPDGGYSSPKTMMRQSGRASARLAGAVTSNISSMTGTVGETFSITFTDEPSESCTTNGTMTGTLTSVEPPIAIVTLDGTLYFTNCTDGTPDHTGDILEGQLKIEAGAQRDFMTFSLRMRYTYSGTDYYTTIGMETSYSDPQGDGAEKWNLYKELYTGTDSLNNTIYTYYSYGWNDAHMYRYYNKSVIDGTTIDFVCPVGSYPISMLSCYGSATLSNGIKIDFDSGQTGENRLVVEASEIDDCTSDINAYHVALQGSAGTFTTNVGYTGAVERSADGSMSGTLMNAAGTTVAAFTCNTGGMCSVDYTDAAIADEQYYATNIMDAMQ